jgi:hypothetical protein
MAVDASILAIPDIGSQVITRTLCSLSLIFSVHCILAGVAARHFGEKMKSLEFAVRVIYQYFLSCLFHPACSLRISTTIVPELQSFIVLPLSYGLPGNQLVARRTDDVNHKPTAWLYLL